MLCCYMLILLFTVQWLSSQYHEQQAQLRKNLTRIFTDVQYKVADSLKLHYILDSNTTTLSTVTAQDTTHRVIALSPQIMSRIINGANISPEEESRLFHIDTMLFNERFASQMKQNGWNFHSEWVNSSDSDSRGEKAIFIQSSFFTTTNGVLVDGYDWYLLRRMWPQLFFSLVLVVLTGAAFYITYRSLRAQIKLSVMKDDFISNMSHELKTPIATVKVALEALNNFNVIDNPARGREYLSMAASEMDRLELLATRVLNTSLLETGKLYIQRESYDLKMLVEEVIMAMRLRLMQHGADITFEHTGSSFTVMIDKLHAQGVLVNLIDNSLKYAGENVHVHISLTERNGAVQLKVTDNGPGIPEEYREKVFEKFFRIPTGARHNTKGYGLGLSYAAQVMRQHNGSISVNNVAEGGCMFTLTF